MRTCPASALRRARGPIARAPLPRGAAATLVSVAALGVSAAPAAATSFPACASNQPRQSYVGQINSAIEGAVVDRQGRLYVTDLIGGRIMRFDAPGMAAKKVATLPAKGGGGALALEPDGTVIVGGGADARVLLGDILRPGYISRLNPETGALTQIARNLSAANGLAVTADGTIYATNDFGGQIGRRLPNGVVQPEWKAFLSANGAVLSPDDQYLYVSRTFVNGGVSRISTVTKSVQSLLTLKGFDSFAAPDGLTLDSQQRPVVPLNAAGEIIRINAPNQACKLASGLSNPSVIVYGNGSAGFSAGRLFSAGFDGRVYEIPAAFDAGA